MFDWFWEFLYLITKSIFRLIDAILDCCDVLCGIEPVTIDGDEYNLIEWLLRHESIANGFRITAIVAVFLVVFFSVWGIIRTIVSEKPDGTPGQIVVRALKSFFMFIFVPAIMIVLMNCLNTIAEALYAATRGGNTSSLGSFMAISFGQDAIKGNYTVSDLLNMESFNYKDTDCVERYMELSDYDFFFSWVAGIAILFSITKVVLIFVDRMFSIILLFIISPIPISASIVDEGQHFKQWREQVLVKFCIGYCAIIGLNIFAIVMSTFSTPDIEYFGNGFLDFVMKLVIILGGAVSLEKIVAMVGNLLKEGAGDNSLKEAGNMQKGIEGVATTVVGLFTGQKKKQGKKNKGSGGDKSGSGGDSGGDSGGGSSGGESDSGSSSNKNPTATSSPGGGVTTSVAAANPQAKAAIAVAGAIEDKKDGDDNKKKKGNIVNTINANKNKQNLTQSSLKKEGNKK